MFSLRHLKYYTSNLILLTSENLGNAQKYENRKYTHNLILRDKFSMEKPHPTPNPACQGSRTPDLPSLHLPINPIPTPTFFQKNLQMAE